MKNLMFILSLLLCVSSFKANAGAVCTVDEVQPIVEVLTPLLGLEGQFFQKPSLSYVDTVMIDATGEERTTYKVKIKPENDANDYNTFIMFVDVIKSKSGKCLLRSMKGTYGAE